MKNILVALLLLLSLSACVETVDQYGNVITPIPTPLTVDSALGIEDTKVGEGAEATIGKTVSVHYTGKLEDGTEFDSSAGGNPISFTLGNGEVIAGWEQGIQGMKAGGKRKLTIPASLAYGEEGRGETIPPNATLIFDVELVSVN